MTGFNSKREAAADKLQEPVNLLEARRIAAEYGTPDSQVDNGNLYFALSKCLEHIDAQPVQEPVAWMLEQGAYIEFERMDYHNGDEWTPLYTTPPQRPWVGLTDEEVHALWMTGEANISKEAHSVTAYEVEAKLKERNHGT
jgi:hypothetical protein